MKMLLILLGCALFLVSCEQNPGAGNARATIGTWILYEIGYSPGAGYITEQIPDNPAQTLSLNDDGSMQTTIHNLGKYRYYIVLESDNAEEKILALFEKKPVSSTPDVSKLEHSYTMKTDEEGNIKLYYRWCIEGCHLALKKRTVSASE